MTKERLQKFMSAAGIASRRQSERMIVAGRVKVNGKTVTELGTRVDRRTDKIQVDGMMVSYDPRHVYLLVYKPTHVISSTADPEGRPVVTELVPETYGRVYPVGRLDWDSEGAILLTNDGELTEYLTHPRYEVTKVYMVKVDGLIANNDPRIDTLRNGVRLDDGHLTQPAEITRDEDTGKHTWFVVAIHEGKNRQIRRMFEAVGIDVRKLKRIAYGPVLLADMRPGQFRRLNEEEIDDLYEAAGQQRKKLSASRGRLPVSRRKRAERDRQTRRDEFKEKVRSSPEALGLKGTYSKSERQLLKRHAEASALGPQSGDGRRQSGDGRRQSGDGRRQSGDGRRQSSAPGRSGRSKRNDASGSKRKS